MDIGIDGRSVKGARIHCGPSIPPPLSFWIKKQTDRRRSYGKLFLKFAAVLIKIHFGELNYLFISAYLEARNLKVYWYASAARTRRRSE